MSYQLRDEDVVWDAFSSTNIVIADLKSGSYATLLGDGAELFWNLLMNQMSLHKILEVCKSYFKEFGKDEAKSLQSLITNLIQFELIKPQDSKEAAYDLPIHPPYQTFNLKLTTYDDMELLLTLDPIDELLEE